jgi:RNA polymerase sigma-70 factor (family 1)
MKNLPDNINIRLLFNLISGGNEQAFKIFFDQHKSDAYAVAFRMTKCALDAEEITQEVFISLWVSRRRLSRVDDPLGYFYTIIYNCVKGYLRKENNEKKLVAISSARTKRVSNITDEMIIAHDSQQIIDEALSKLSPQKKLIYKMNRRHGRTYSEIGEKLNLSPHTVKSHLMETVKFIRHYFERITIIIASFEIFFKK